MATIGQSIMLRGSVTSGHLQMKCFNQNFFI
jgi:hypothetical protein